MGLHSPIAQFEVHDMSGSLFSLAGHPITFTNFSLACVLAVVFGSLLVFLPLRRRAVVPGRWQVFVEIVYNAIVGVVDEASGPKAKPFLPFVFTLFMFILLCNLFGLIPGIYTPTSQLVANLLLSFSVLAVIIVAGFWRHGFKFLNVFVPHGVPGILVPFLAVLEFVSFFIRPFSLSLRLFGNMLAGHILLKVFAAMVAAIATSGWVASVGVFPVIMDVAIVAFELFVALIQAYVFTVLSAVYLRDALEMH